ncbi:MAG: hypothetical protein WC610_04210 [Patescibacteria group bacterium]
MATTKEKLNLLPQKIQDALSSEVVGLINEELCRQYGVSQIAKNTKILADLIFKDLAINQLSVAIAAAFGFSPEKSNQMAVDIAGRFLLIFDDYFNGEVAKYIKSLGGNIDDYQADIENQKKAIAETKAQREKEEAEEKEEMPIQKEAVSMIESNDEEEKQHAPMVFKQNILDFLSAETEELKEIIDDYNGVLIMLMEKDNNFRRGLEEALYENQEPLGQSRIMIEGKSLAPIVANWLRDFIFKYGTDLFTNVVLSEYLTNSENVKKLSPEEKKILAKLLMLYRNLKFFPEGLAGLPPEKWEIIPIDRFGYEEKFTGQELASPASPRGEPASTQPRFAARRGGEPAVDDLEIDFDNMSPIELKAFMEANNLSEAEMQKLKNS